MRSFFHQGDKERDARCDAFSVWEGRRSSNEKIVWMIVTQDDGVSFLLMENQTWWRKRSRSGEGQRKSTLAKMRSLQNEQKVERVIWMMRVQRCYPILPFAFLVQTVIWSPLSRGWRWNVISPSCIPRISILLFSSSYSRSSSSKQVYIILEDVFRPLILSR